MPRKLKRRKSALQPRSGLKPGEYVRRSTVWVETLDMDKASKELYQTDPYNVETHREDGRWDATIRYKGDKWSIPGKVLDQLVRHRESIITEARRRKALERFERLHAMAEARAVRASATNATWNISFNEVEAERAIDLAGM